MESTQETRSAVGEAESTAFEGDSRGRSDRRDGSSNSTKEVTERGDEDPWTDGESAAFFESLHKCFSGLTYVGKGSGSHSSSSNPEGGRVKCEGTEPEDGNDVALKVRKGFDFMLEVLADGVATKDVSQVRRYYYRSLKNVNEALQLVGHETIDWYVETQLDAIRALLSYWTVQSSFKKPLSDPLSDETFARALSLQLSSDQVGSRRRAQQFVGSTHSSSYDSPLRKKREERDSELKRDPVTLSELLNDTAHGPHVRWLQMHLDGDEFAKIFSLITASIERKRESELASGKAKEHEGSSGLLSRGERIPDGSSLQGGDVPSTTSVPVQPIKSVVTTTKTKDREYWTLKLTPLFKRIGDELVTAGFNPNLELTVSPKRKLCAIFSHLQSKWAAVCGENPITLCETVFSEGKNNGERHEWTVESADTLPISSLFGKRTETPNAGPNEPSLSLSVRYSWGSPPPSPPSRQGATRTRTLPVEDTPHILTARRSANSPAVRKALIAEPRALPVEQQIPMSPYQVPQHMSPVMYRPPPVPPTEMYFPESPAASYPAARHFPAPFPLPYPQPFQPWYMSPTWSGEMGGGMLPPNTGKRQNSKEALLRRSQPRRVSRAKKRKQMEPEDGSGQGLPRILSVSPQAQQPVSMSVPSPRNGSAQQSVRSQGIMESPRQFSSLVPQPEDGVLLSDSTPHNAAAHLHGALSDASSLLDLSPQRLTRSTGGLLGSQGEGVDLLLNYYGNPSIDDYKAGNF